MLNDFLKRVFSDFVLYPPLHKEFLRAESGKSFVSTATSKDICTVLAVWRVINFSKDALSLFSLCVSPWFQNLGLKLW